MQILRNSCLCLLNRIIENLFVFVLICKLRLVSKPVGAPPSVRAVCECLFNSAHVPSYLIEWPATRLIAFKFIIYLYEFYGLTKTLANRLSNSLWSGIGTAARLRTLACRTWWFCCWCFQLWLMLATGDIADTFTCTSCCGGISRDNVKPILSVATTIRAGFHAHVPPNAGHKSFVDWPETVSFSLCQNRLGTTFNRGPS